jgi:hypothetical protein
MPLAPRLPEADSEYIRKIRHAGYVSKARVRQKLDMQSMYIYTSSGTTLIDASVSGILLLHDCLLISSWYVVSWFASAAPACMLENPAYFLFYMQRRNFMKKKMATNTLLPQIVFLIDTKRKPPHQSSHILVSRHISSHHLVNTLKCLDMPTITRLVY